MSDNKIKILFFVITTSIFIFMGIIGSFLNQQAKTEALLITVLTASTTTEVTTQQTIETTTQYTTHSYTETTSQPQSVSDTASPETVYIGKTGTKYHKQDCSSLKGGGSAVSLSEALAQGRTPCKICEP